MKNRQMSALRLAFFFVGCFLGAGYLSGREIWEFFGERGISGFICILPSIAILLLTGLMILYLSGKTGKRSAEELVLPYPIPKLKTVFTLIQTLFLINIAVIMTSGASALIQQLFNLPGFVGGLIFCTVTVACSIAGVRGVIRVFSGTIPVLTVFVVILTVITCVKTGVLLPIPSSKAIGIGQLGISAILYASYNLFGSVPIIAAVSDRIPSNRVKRGGLIIGSFMLVLIAVCVFICQVEMPSAAEQELPLLAVAQSYSVPVGILFGLLLLCAMFGTALSTVVAAKDMACLKWPKLGLHPLFIAIFEFIAMIAGSFLGFSNLISFIYPAFGYAGIAIIVLLIIHCILVCFSTRRVSRSGLTQREQR